MKLKKADLLLFKGRGNSKNYLKFWDKNEQGEYCWAENFVQYTIKKITKGQYCHVGIVINPKKLVIAEALNQGFTVWEANGYIDRLIIDGKVHVYRVDGLSVKEVNKVIKEILSLEGSKYDYKDILDIFLTWLTGYKFKFGNALNIICSEGVALGFSVIRKYFDIEKDEDDITPVDIAKSDITMKLSREELGLGVMK